LAAPVLDRPIPDVIVQIEDAVSRVTSTERQPTMRRLLRSSVLLFGTALASTSCSSKDQPASGPGASCDGGTAPVDGKCTAPSTGPCDTGSLLIDGQCVAQTSPWTEIKPGGTTTCMRGDPYSFFVHKGTSNKLLLYFAFGGLCYNAQLCSQGAVNYVPKVNVDPDMLAKTSGIIDLNRPDNPFKDWSWVYIPECTADFEWGDTVVDYPAMGTSPAVTVNHNGFVNVTAVRDWVYQNFTSPERIFVSGSSGGGDAAFLHTAYLHQHYASVKNWTFFADASFGITTEDFLTTDIASWNAYAKWPKWIPAIASASPAQLTWDFAEIETSKYYKDMTIAEFGTSYDSMETLVFGIMGGNQTEWHDRLETHLQNVSAKASTFRHLVAPGTAHIVLNQPTFYQYEVNGTSLRDWVAALVDGHDVKSDQCTSNCKLAPRFPVADGGGAGVTEVQFLCLSNANCNPGEVCCASLPGQSSCSSGTTCQGLSLQMCMDGSECPAGKNCSPLTVQGASVSLCQ
jgi:hypothetical protein